MSIRRLSSATLVIFGAITLAQPRGALADDDGLEPYRERFRLGMDRYKAGALSEALRVWGAIYEELGPHRGYRLAYNLGRAHDANGEATRAAERYTSFLDEVGKRRAAGEAIPELVEHEEAEATDRIRNLNRTHGRIQVAPRIGTELAQVDDSDPRLGSFTAYVAPGRHVVVFGAGRPDAEKVEVSVGADELTVAKATPLPEPPPALPPPPPAIVRTVRETTHPLSPTILYVALGATAVSFVAPAVGYAHAYSVFDTAHANNTGQNRAAYSTAETTAYALWSIPAAFGGVTAGLIGWYFAGAKPHDVVVSAAPQPGGGVGSIAGSF